MDKFDYIELIVLDLKGTTDINFQVKVGEILRRYYTSINKTYEMPNSSGGDDKNDGWVVEDQLFYQIYSPQQIKESFRKDMQKKYLDDFSQLLNLIYNHGKWGKHLKKFVYLVNTIDRNLPHDSEGYFKLHCEKLGEKYGEKFEYEVTNVAYIRGILENMDIDGLRSISTILRLKSIMDFNAISAKTMYEVIDGLSGMIQEKVFSNVEDKSYDRISSVKKIELNNLTEKKVEIEKMIEQLDIVEKMISTINQDLLYSDKFNRVKGYIISTYNSLSDTLSGTELYDKLIGEIIEYAEFNKGLIIPCKLLVIYIFDRCDIFEKDEHIIKEVTM